MSAVLLHSEETRRRLGQHVPHADVQAATIVSFLMK
jgi:hypothetical protein